MFGSTRVSGTESDSDFVTLKVNEGFDYVNYND